MDDKQVIEEKIKTVLSKVLNKKIGEDEKNRPLRELGLDSMGMIEFIPGLENKFDIMFDDEDIVPESFETLASVTELVVKKIN